jgi:uncharacterized protein involved in response to NO
MLINIEDPKPKAPPNGFALFALGFRPFFLLAGIAAVAMLAVWVGLYRGDVALGNYYGTVVWHSHEMLFGYAAAVVAGFLLTAVRNWTGVDTITRIPLAILAGIWVLGRVLPFLSEVLPGAVIAVVDLLFIPALVVAIAHPIIKAKMWNNLFFVPLLLAYAAGNALLHAQLLGLTENTLNAANTLGIAMIILLLAIMGGRVIGFFIERGLGGVQVKSWPLVEKLCIISILFYFSLELMLSSGVVLAVTALLTAVIHTIRLVGWYHKGVWSISLLWVLYLGYAWIAVGFLLKALAALGYISPFLALHAFTAGAIGVMTLGMMARVSLGHSGREMRAVKGISLAFALVNLAAIVRVLLPMVMPDHYVALISASGVIWVVAFLLFAFVYTPILIRPRVDGRPG